MIQYGKHGHDRGMDDTESLEWNVKKRGKYIICTNEHVLMILII